MSPEFGPPEPADIMMIDVVPVNLQVLGEILREQGFKVRPILSGTMALEAALNKPPQLILMDVNMPEIDGYDVCKRFKASPKLADIPIIFVSAKNGTIDKVKAFQVGGVDYITKPFEIAEVMSRINTHLSAYRQKEHIKKAYEQLRQLEEKRDQLVHLVIHDLRTPLAIIGGFLGLVLIKEKDCLSVEGVAGIEKAIRQTRRLVGMVSTVLDVSKIEDAKMNIRPEASDLNGLLAEIALEFEPLVNDRKLIVEPAPDPVTINIDRELVERVLSNLLVNAIKFTPIGSEIRVSLETHTDYVRVAVADNGIGISKDGQAKLFEKFSQVETTCGRAKSSSGLGLYFCRLAIEAHGGDVGVVSDEGKGTTFWFRLPR